jgi:ceramide glucosyltransferase
MLEWCPMTILAWLAAILAAALLALHVATAVIVAVRARRSWRPSRTPPQLCDERLTILRPVCGVVAAEQKALATSAYPTDGTVEVLFCVARADDPVVPFLENLIAAHPGADARLLLGDVRGAPNPKLDNVIKGWRAARHPRVALVDANVPLSADGIARMRGVWPADTGLVSAPGVAAAPVGLWAEVEAGYLDTYHARWLYAGDTLGRSYAQGKTLLFRKAELERWGGIESLAQELAEDAAATKLVRSAGKRVRLADPPVRQLLGERDAASVLTRQVRWAKLRRLAFPGLYAGEVLTTSLTPMLLGAFAGEVLTEAGSRVAGGILALWLTTEAILAKIAGWHLSWRSPFAWIVRDVTLPVVWLLGWRRSGYRWRGNDIDIARAEA